MRVKCQRIRGVLKSWDKAWRLPCADIAGAAFPPPPRAAEVVCVWHPAVSMCIWWQESSENGTAHVGVRVGFARTAATRVAYRVAIPNVTPS